MPDGWGCHYSLRNANIHSWSYDCWIICCYIMNNIICSNCLSSLCTRSFVSLLDSCVFYCNEGWSGIGAGISAAAGIGVGATADACAGVDGAVGAGAVDGAMAFFTGAITVNLCRWGNYPSPLRRGAGSDFVGERATGFLRTVRFLIIRIWRICIVFPTAVHAFPVDKFLFRNLRILSFHEGERSIGTAVRLLDKHVLCVPTLSNWSKTESDLKTAHAKSVMPSIIMIVFDIISPLCVMMTLGHQSFHFHSHSMNDAFIVISPVPVSLRTSNTIIFVNFYIPKTLFFMHFITCSGSCYLGKNLFFLT